GIRGAARDGRPGNERQALVLAQREHVRRAAIGDVVAVLHRDDRRHAARAGELRDAEIRYAHVADLAFLLQARQLPDRILQRYLRIDAVELIQIDAREPEALQACLA